MLIEVLSEQEGSLLAARRAHVKSAAGEGAKVLEMAVWILATDPGHALAVVTAG
jgi:hypothetical protein